MPLVSVKGSRIHYSVESPPARDRGPAVVFVHGAGGTHEHWRFQVRCLGLKRTALAVDLPGHGESQGDGCRSVPAYRDFLRDLLDALGMDRTALVGHSMGGGIVQSFALVYPDRAAAVALVGTGARLRVHPDIFLTLQRSLEEAARLISQWAYSPAASPATAAWGAEALARNRVSVLEGDFRACEAFDLMDQVAAIRTRTLILCGEEDRLTPAKYARFLHQQIPDSVLTIVPGAGHMVMLEKPTECNRALEAFLDADLPTTA